MAKFDDDLFEDVEYTAPEDMDDSLFEDEEVETPSQLETAARGVGQGLTMGFLDELIGAFKAGGGASPRQMLEDPKKAMKKERELMKRYMEETAKQRKIMEAGRKAHPWTAGVSEVAGGILPAIATGGGTAMAQTGKAIAGQAAKGGTAKALTQLAKEGAKMGSIYGLGESEGETVGEMALDTLKGGTTGAVAAPVLGVGMKAAGKGVQALKKGAGELAEKFPTISKPFKFAKEHGMTTAKERSKMMEEQIKGLIKDIKSAFKKSGMSDDLADEQVNQLQKTFDVTEDFGAVANQLRDQAKYLPKADADKILKQAQQIDDMVLGAEEVAARQLARDTETEILKKLDASDRKEVMAPIKSESKMVQHAEKYGDELENIQESTKAFEDVSDLLYDTKGGKIHKSRGKFKEQLVDEYGQPYTQDYEKTIIQDTTPFDPSQIKVSKQGDRMVAEYLNQSTGEVFKKYGKVPDKGLDLKSVSIDDLLEQQRIFGQKAFDANNADSQMYRELWKVSREKIKEVLPHLSQKKQDQAKLFQLMDILGVDKSLMNKPASHSEMVKMIKGVPRKMDVEKSYLERNILKEGDEISERMGRIADIDDVSQILEGVTSNAGEFSRAGILQKSTGVITEAGGSLYGKVARAGQAVGKFVEPATSMVSKMVNKMTPQHLNNFRNKLLAEGSEGSAYYAKEIERLATLDPRAKDQALFALSQQPGFRKKLGSFLKDRDQDFTEATGIETQGINQILEGEASQPEQPEQQDAMIPFRPEEDEPERKPASVEEVEPVQEEKEELSFEEAFNKHYETVKDLPANERPNLVWKGKEYKAVKADESEDISNEDFFKPQTEGVDLDIDKNLLDKVREIAEKKGYKELTASSGKRGIEKTKGILESRKAREGLTNLKPEVEAVIDKILLRGNSPEDIEYPKGNWYGKASKDLKKVGREDLLDEVANIRSDFGGYESGHLKGSKMDIPYSSFKNDQEAKEFIKELREGGLEVIDEEKAGQRGVIDIRLKEEADKNLTRHEKYIGSGGQALYSSTGDDLMGTIDKLPMSEEEKDVANDAVANGDIQYLREIFNQYKGIVS
jgi:hypothetical protein